MTELLLMNNCNESIDVYYYKLILATLCSKHDLGEAFEEIASQDWSILLERYQKAKGEPKSFVEVLRYTLKEVLKVKIADEIINAAYDRLFSLSVPEILTDILNCYHMDRKLLYMLRSDLTKRTKTNAFTLVTEATWQQLKAHLLAEMRKGLKLESKFIGEGSSFFGMVKKTLGFYVKRNLKNIFDIVNQTGMYVVDENEFSMSMLSIQNLSSGSSYDVDFPAVLQSIYKLNSLIYTHSAENVEKYYYYDLLSHYRLPLLEEYHKSLSAIFARAFKTEDKNKFVMVYENKDLRNAGVKEKYQKYNELLGILDPVVKRGLSPGAVEKYVEQIYLHVLKTQKSSSSNLFTINDVKDGIYNTSTAFSKMEGHEIIKDVLDGVMALHHLFMYISAHNINIFDLDSEVFMYEPYLYRFISVEEVVDFYMHTKSLISRPEDSSLVNDYEENQLPLNDDVVRSVGVDSVLGASLHYLNIFDRMGDLTASGRGRKERGKKQNHIYARFVDALEDTILTRQSLEKMTAAVKFGNSEFSIPFLKYIKNIADQNDLVSALEIPAFQAKGVKARLACEKNIETGYWEVPQYPFSEYCMGNTQISGLVRSLHTQEESIPDSILEVYRTSAFFISMSQMFQLVEDSLYKIYRKFDIITDVPMGYFDAYAFVSNHLTICQLRSLDELQAISKITEIMRTELFITARTGSEQIILQLVRVYRMFLKKFEKVLLSLETITDMYYTDFSNRLGGGYSLVGDESFFEQARREALMERYAHTTPEFEIFASGCSKTMKGFLKKDGKLVTRVEKGIVMFLNEKGIWIGKANNSGHFEKRQVIDGDFAGGI